VDNPQICAAERERGRPLTLNYLGVCLFNYLEPYRPGRAGALVLPMVGEHSRFAARGRAVLLVCAPAVPLRTISSVPEWPNRLRDNDDLRNDHAYCKPMVANFSSNSSIGERPGSLSIMIGQWPISSITLEARTRCPLLVAPGVTVLFLSYAP
jgi:hypothetical protein